jgi:hypothetical protein
MMNRIAVKIVLCSTAVFLSACAPKSYVVDMPETSPHTYISSESQRESVLNFVDERENADMSFTSGVLSMDLAYEGAPLDPMEFLEEFTIAELQARGIPVSAGVENSTAINVNTFLMRNYRSGSYVPFTVITLLSADIETSEGEQRVVIFLKRGKVPVWSFQEIVEPTLNQPLELLVQTLAAKINAVVYGQVVGDDVVDQLVRDINSGKDGGLTYQHVYQLGFTNNPRAIQPLIEFSKSKDEYIRLAAISALGTLNAQSQLDYLISIFKSDADWQDRAMAAKSVGDLGLMGNDQAMSFLRENVEEILGESKKVGAAWAREIVDLYLAE